MFLGFMTFRPDHSKSIGEVPKAVKSEWLSDMKVQEGRFNNLKNCFIVNRPLMQALFSPSLPSIMDYVDGSLTVFSESGW